MTSLNPFNLYNYTQPKFFCNRNEETELIMRKVENGENVILISRNGIGKTSLVKNVFYHLNKKNEFNLIYCDLLQETQISQFVECFLLAVLESFSTKSLKKIDKLNNILSDKTSDNQLKTFNKFTKAELIFKFNEVLLFLDAQKKRTIIVLDNYDIGSRYPNNEFENIIIKPIESCVNIQQIFSGAKNSLSFANEEIITLGEISNDIYKNFINNHFESSGISIKTKNLDKILSWSRSNICATQLVCFKLWETRKNKIKSELVDEVTHQILLEHECSFYMIINLLSAYQLKLLRAIALEGEAVQITSANFIRRYELNAPSSVNTALKALIEKEMIYRIDNSYLISNVILGRWLTTQ
jgi:uncharacterized protein